jgi:predicted Abi (CAAX) family protease
MTQSTGQRESLFGLAKQLIGGGVRLARLEVQQGRQEVAEMLRETRGGVIRLAIAGAFGLLTIIALVSFLVLGVAALTGLPEWLIALIAVLLFAAIAAFLAWQGIRKIKVGRPEQTIASVKEDIEWAKRLLRRD